MDYEYDIAISFAGERRSEAEAIEACLQKDDIKVFFDGCESANF